MSKTSSKNSKKVVVKTTTTKGKTTEVKTNNKLVSNQEFINLIVSAVVEKLQQEKKPATKIEKKETPKKKVAKATKKKSEPRFNISKTLVNKVIRLVKGSDARQIKAIGGYLNKLRTDKKIEEYLTWLGKSKQSGRKCDLQVAKAILENATQKAKKTK